MIDKFFEYTNTFFVDKEEHLLTKCLVCEHPFVSDKEVLWNKYVQCDLCGAFVPIKRYSDAVLTEYYTKSGAREIWDKFKSTPEEHIRQQKKYQVVLDFINTTPDIKSVFDYGCGNGYFLNLVKDTINKDLVLQGYDINLSNTIQDKICYKNELDKIKLPEESLITFFGVLEHITNFNALRFFLLNNYFKYLAVIVPNAESLIIKTIKEQCCSFCPQHLTFFNLQALKTFAYSVGFKHIYSTTIESESEPLYRASLCYPSNAYNKSILVNKDVTEVIDNIVKNSNMGYKIVAIFKNERGE